MLRGDLAGTAERHRHVLGAQALQLPEAIRQRRLERLDAAAVGRRDHEARRLQAGGSMQVQRAAGLELEVAVGHGVLDQRGDGRVERGIDGVAVGNDEQRIGRDAGEYAGRSDVVSEVHNAVRLDKPTMLFDSTLRRDLARSFAATLVVVLTIVLTMMLIRTLGQAAGGRVSPQDVVLLLGYLALGQLPTMLALSMFIAVVATLSRMYRESEMAIWFASGVGLTRFVRPVLRTSVPVLIVVGILAIFVWPWVNQRGVEL